MNCRLITLSIKGQIWHSGRIPDLSLVEIRYGEPDSSIY